MISLEIPNYRDVNTYELFGFLKCYIKKLAENLENNLDEIGED